MMTGQWKITKDSAACKRMSTEENGGGGQKKTLVLIKL